jgi:cytochrome P450
MHFADIIPSPQFGYGSRTCIGRNLALVEIMNFVAGFVHRYNARFKDAQRPYVVKSQWFSYQADMFLKLEARGLAIAKQ